VSYPATDSKLYAALWGGLNAALVLSSLRVRTPHETAQVEAQTGARWLESLLDFAANVEPTAHACAQQQLACDALQGRPVYAASGPEGAVWLAYPGTHWMSHALHVGTTHHAVVDNELQTAHYMSRHDGIASARGGGNIAFTMTHSMTQGDAFDAGCFADRDIFAADLRHWAHRHTLEVENFLDEVSNASAHTGRQPGTLAHETGVRIQVLCEQFGPTDGAAILVHAMRTLLTGYHIWLPQQFDMPPLQNPADAAALFARFWRSVGVDVAVEKQRDCPCVTLQLIDVWPHLQPFSPTVPEALIRAWSSALAHLDFNLRCWMAAPPEADGRFTVVFGAGQPLA